MNLNKLIFFFLLIGCIGCKTNGTKLILLEEKSTVEVKLNSACRASVILPINDEELLKKNIQMYADAGIKKMKLKTNSSADKATCRIKNIELVITESCPTKLDGNAASLKLHQKLILEQLKTKELLVFEVDSVINNQKLTPNQLAVKKVDYQSYIPPLTERNLSKLKDFYKKKK